MIVRPARFLFSAAGWCALALPAWAQLQVTELMVDPLAANDDAWEWIEVRNTGAMPIDLNGYIFDRLGDPSSPLASIDGALAANTVVPAGGVAVIYDGNHPLAAADYNDALFRTAWGLAPSVPLIAANNFPALTNSGGTAFGLWADAASYSDDLADDGTGTFRVASFNNAALSLDFRTASGFPASSSGISLAWNGQGAPADGANWADTTSGTTSVVATVPGSVNDARDVGNPGVFPTGAPPTGITFTEIMFNPRSPEPQWEWVEIFNNTGATIDFAATPYVFDDDDDGALTAANVSSGMIPNGTGAVLFNASTTNGVTLSDMQAAWDPNGARGINFIPLTASTAFTQGGDPLALWSSLAAYQSEPTTGQGRTFDNAVAKVIYDDEAANMAGVTGLWPTDDGNGSIYLTSFTADPADGGSWLLSTSGDGISFNATAIAGTITIHPGGELATPGVFAAGPVTNDADFDNSGLVDGRDFLIWQRNFGTGATNAQGDADGNGQVNAADLAAWKAAFGATVPTAAATAAVPEPAGGLLLAAAAAIAPRLRRRAAK